MPVSLGFKCAYAENTRQKSKYKIWAIKYYSKANLILNIISNLKYHRMEKNG